jgi:hypothetical protein
LFDLLFFLAPKQLFFLFRAAYGSLVLACPSLHVQSAQIATSTVTWERSG